MNVLLDLKDLKHGRDFFELKPSRGILWFTLSLLALLAISIYLIGILEMDEVVKANAILRPVGTISSLRSISGGQIASITYHNDMTVHAGDPLWAIDVKSDQMDLENAKHLNMVLKQDLHDTSILLRTVNNDRNMADSSDSQAWILSESWLGEKKRLEQAAEQSKVRLEREKSMPDNMRSSQKIEDLSAEYRAAQTEIANHGTQQIIKCSDDIKALNQNIQSTEQRISDVERKIANATVTAPISGRIDEIVALNVGDYVLAGEEILKIIPQDSASIKAELQVDPADIARIKGGQTVFLRFPALPPSDFGQLEAKVSLVPADVSLGSGNIAVFLVEANIANACLTAPNGEKINLRSGMGAQARIKLSRETVLRMILHKLDFIGKA